MSRLIPCLLVLCSLCLSGASGKAKKAPSAPPAGARADLSGLQTWAIQLQGADISEIVAADYDLVVIDYSKDGTDSGAYSHSEIESVRSSGTTVIAYLSIGEASDFRFYWQDDWTEGSPSFIGPANPNWPGAYRAQYWKRGWWDQAIRPHLDRILDAGFDGVSLDGIDTYWFWYLQGQDPVRSADRMAQLVRKVAEYARERAGEDFIVCPTNGLSMLDDTSAKWRRNYVADIDAVLAESLFYNYYSAENQAYRILKLEELALEGKTILSLEYLDLSLIDEYFGILAQQSAEMIGYPADPDRLLDELVLY
ncbi:MAG: MJ1477/TM1410 family putative glycoside hydrolase [Planctomycetota bacterium]|jgi:cysteinyl-tRNA synthetase